MTDRLTPTRVAFGLGAAGVLYRIILLAAGLPPTNSDEATMGLMARHIIAGLRAPVFFYGQHYMGATEAYLAVPFFAVFDSSTVALRASTVVMYAAFLAAAFLLVRELWTPWFAAAVTGLLALGSDRVIKNQLIAGGGYPEINLLAAALLLLAVVLARTPGRGAGWYALFGFGAGVALWSDYLVVPYLAAAGALLVAFRGRALLGRRAVALIGGALLGLAPVIAHDLGAAPRDRSLHVLGQLSRAGQDQLAGTTLADHLHGGVLVGVPMATGLCRPSRCDAPQLWWGAAFAALLLVAAGLALAGLRTADRVAHAGRLGLAGAGLATIGLYGWSPAAVLTPIESARYLSCLLVSVPAALWPLWRTAGARSRVHPPIRRVLAAGAAAVLAAVVVAAGVATATLVPEAGRVRAAVRAQQVLLDDLDQHGTRHIYSDYWTCNRLVFATRERVVCAVLGDDLRSGLDRYRPYRDTLAGWADPVYALPVGSTVDREFAAHLARAGVDAQVREVAGYRLYHPNRPAGVPIP